MENVKIVGFFFFILIFLIIGKRGILKDEN